MVEEIENKAVGNFKLLKKITKTMGIIASLTQFEKIV